MRLANPVYESLPLVYLLAGALLCFASYRLHSGVLSVLLLIAGTLGMIAGVAVWLRRRDFRAADPQYRARESASDADDQELR
jgi:hypothetical protein